MNQTKVTVFNNEEFGDVRTIMIDNEPWFVGRDVANILGYSNSRQAISTHVDDEDKKDGVTVCDSIGREQNPVLINESGLYSLIFGSKLESEIKFKNWVTKEVLPCIRKNGIYATDNVIDNILNNPDFGIELLTKLKEERAARIEAEKTNAILMHVNKTYTMT